MIPERFREDYDPDPYDDDRREDARREAAEDAWDRAAETCSECGERWDPGYHPATRIDPGYVDRPECPRCGSGPVSQETREAVRERLGTLEQELDQATASGDAREVARLEELVRAIENAR